MNDLFQKLIWWTSAVLSAPYIYLRNSMWFNCLTVNRANLTISFISDVNIEDLFIFQEKEGKPEDLIGKLKN